jgi:methyl-accepting chemotaxis protein
MNWFHDMGIKAKLLSGFVLVAMIAGVIGAVGVTQIKKIDAADTKMYASYAAPMGDLMDMATYYQRMRINMRDMILATTPAETEQYATAMNELVGMRQASAKSYENTIVTDEMKAVFAEYQAADADYVPVMQEIERLAKAGKDVEATVFMHGEKAAAAAKGLQASLDKMAEMKGTGGKALSDENTKLANKATATMLLLMGIGVLLAVVLGVFIATAIATPLKNAVDVLQELNRGHLGTRLKMTRKDEVGVLAQTMDAFADDLQHIVVGTMRKIAVGDLTTEVQVKDPQDEIAPALSLIKSS